MSIHVSNSNYFSLITRLKLRILSLMSTISSSEFCLFTVGIDKEIYDSVGHGNHLKPLSTFNCPLWCRIKIVNPIFQQIVLYLTSDPLISYLFTYTRVVFSISPMYMCTRLCDIKKCSYQQIMFSALDWICVH